MSSESLLVLLKRCLTRLKDAHFSLNSKTVMALTPSDRLVDHTETQFPSFDTAVINNAYKTVVEERTTVMDTVEELIKCRERLTLQIEELLRDQRLKGCL